MHFYALTFLSFEFNKSYKLRSGLFNGENSAGSSIAVFPGDFTWLSARL